MIDQAFILCAGFGRRLQPHTLTTPKPLTPVAGQSLLSRTCEHLNNFGVKKAVLNTHYLADQIQAAAPHLQINDIAISHEEELMDTGGGISKALANFSGEPFFVLSGDGLWENAPHQNTLAQMSDAWDPNIMDILILLQPKESMRLTKGVGDYHMADNGKLTRAHDQNGTHMFTSMRINHPRIFANAPQNEAFSYLQLLDQAEKEGRLYGIEHAGDWHHISTPEDLARVEQHYSGHITAEKAHIING